MEKCEKCGGRNIWMTVGVFGPEGRCLDCNPPPGDAAKNVAEWVKQIEKEAPDSPQCIENIEAIGPAGRAAIPLLRRIYQKHGTRNYLGCAAKDALRTFEKLN